MILVKQGKTADCMNVYLKDGVYYAKNEFVEDYVRLGRDVNVEEISTSRDYQVTTVRETVDYISKKFMRLAVVLATGAGKTWTTRQLLCFPELREVLGIKDRPLKVLFVAGKSRLLKQGRNTFEGLEGTEVFFLSAFARGVPPEAMDFDIAVYDEGQHEAMTSWQTNLPDIGSKPIIYLTATPDRPDGRLLKVDKEVNTISRKELEDRGLLARPGVYSILDPGLKSSERVNLILEYFMEYEEEFGKTLITVSQQKEARRIHEHLISMDVKSGLVVGVTETEVDNLIEQLESGELDVLVNCNKLNEGVDIKGLTDLIAGRQFGSSVDQNQNIGRVVRPDDRARVHQFINPNKKSLNALDVVGKAEFHILREFRGNSWRECEMKY